MFTNCNDIIIEKLVEEDQREIAQLLVQQSFLRALNADRKNTLVLDLLNRVGIVLISSGEKLKKFAEKQSQKNSQTLVTS